MNRTPEEERIFDALSRADTPAFDPTPAVLRAIHEAPAGRRAGHTARPRVAAALLAACLLLSVTAGAVMLRLSGGWSHFFPAAEAPEGAVSAAGVSQTVEGYTLTIEDAIADTSGLLLMTSLKRTDGGVLEDCISYSSYNSSLSAKFLVDGEETYLGGGSDMSLSEDGKTAYFLYDLDSSKTPSQDFTNVLNRRFTLHAPRVSVSEHLDASIPGEVLSALYAAHPARLASPDEDADDAEKEAFARALDEALRAQEAAVPETLRRFLPDFDGPVLRGLVYLDGVPAPVYAQTARPPHSDALDADLADEFIGGLTDERDGGFYAYAQAHSSPMYDARGREREDAYNMIVNFDPVLAAFGPEALASLRFTYTCRVEYARTHTPFTLSFTPKTDNLVTRTLDFETAFDGQTLRVTDCALSARSIRIATHWSETFDGAYDKLHSIRAILRDGAAYTCNWKTGSGGDNTLWIQYEPVNADGNRVFLDASQITALEIAGKTVPLPAS